MPIWLSSLQQLQPGSPLPALPVADLLIVTSSGEIGMLAAPSSKAWLQALTCGSPQAPVHMVSIGCSGVAASVLEFIHSHARIAHVLVIESPSEWVQSTLDAAGVGAGGDGFQAQDVAFVLTLTRSAKAPTTESVKVLYCNLLSRDPCMGGTAQLAARLASIVINLHQQYPQIGLVRFENGSQWSNHLNRLVDVLLQRQGLPGTGDWLASIECDLRHYMCGRPLLDWQVHAKAANKTPLLLASLAAGGRLGLLVLGDHSLPISQLPVPTPLPLDLSAPLAEWWHSEREPPQDVLYAQREYFGRHQFYFRWKLINEHISNIRLPYFNP